MIKNILIRRKESDTYLATVSRHRWSLQTTMKNDEILQLSASTVAFISLLINIFFIIRKLNYMFQQIKDVFLNQKRINVCSHTFILFWLRKTSVIVKTYQLNFHVFIWAFHLEISSFFYPYFYTRFAYSVFDKGKSREVNRVKEKIVQHQPQKDLSLFLQS